MASVRKQNCIGESNFRPLSAFSFFSHFLPPPPPPPAPGLCCSGTNLILNLSDSATPFHPIPAAPCRQTESAGSEAALHRSPKTWMIWAFRHYYWIIFLHNKSGRILYFTKVIKKATSQLSKPRRSMISSDDVIHKLFGTGSFQHCCHINCWWLHEGKRKTNRAFWRPHHHLR